MAVKEVNDQRRPHLAERQNRQRVELLKDATHAHR